MNPELAKKNWTLFAILIAMVIILFLMTLLRYGGTRILNG